MYLFMPFSQLSYVGKSGPLYERYFNKQLGMQVKQTIHVMKELHFGYYMLYVQQMRWN